MVRSMTGYGRAQEQVNGRDITVELKAVNHRFFEFSARVPRAYGYMEEKLKALVSERTSRGKVEASLTVLTLSGAPCQVQLNAELAKAYTQSLRTLCEPLGLRDDLSLAALCGFSDLFSVRRSEENEEELAAAVLPVAKRALSHFIAMREAEGGRLKNDILEKLAQIEHHVSVVESRSPQTLIAYRERLTQRITEVLADRAIDEGRILCEAAIFAERIAVDEETVRLRSHLAQFKKILEAPEAMGRKLDFLVQEINRETNTIGSKAQDVEINQLVVEMKSEIEKIREQIQNIE